MAEGISRGSIFESINLGSTIGRTIGGSDLNASNRRVPESVSATSDDDELDPNEFLSQGLPQILLKKNNVSIDDDAEGLGKVGILNSTTILGDRDASKNEEQVNESQFKDTRNETGKGNESISSLFDSSILNDLKLSQSFVSMQKSNSIIFTKPDSRKETTLKMLLEANNDIYAELRKNIKLQKKLLVNGDDTSSVRDFISHNFNQLSENFYSLGEIYSQKVTSNRSLYESFKRWDKRRERILNKISLIKSNKNKHGSKLEKLLDESSNIDGAILDLEKKLSALRLKKKLINSEIEDTSSVLESRTSKYVDMFKTLEKQGTEAIMECLNVKYILPEDLESSIKYVPVDVTFSKNYKQGLKCNVSNSEVIASHIFQDNNATPNEVKKSDFIGMQPLIIPETPKDKELANHGHGLTPFQEGLEQGSQAARNIKSQLNSFIKGVVTKSLYEKDAFSQSRQIDDTFNTINKKIDIEPIANILDRLEENSQVMLRTCSEKATLYHEYHIIWNDIINIIKNQEGKLLYQLSESTMSKDEIEKNIIAILSSSLEQIRTYMESKKASVSDRNPKSFNFQDSALSKIILHEIRAICSALSVASGETEWLEKVDEFKSFFEPNIGNKTHHEPGYLKVNLRNSLSGSYKPSTIYKPSKTIPSTGTTSINYVSSGSSSVTSNPIQDKEVAGNSIDSREVINLNSKFVKKE